MKRTLYTCDLCGANKLGPGDFSSFPIVRDTGDGLRCNERYALATDLEKAPRHICRYCVRDITDTAPALRPR